MDPLLMIVGVMAGLTIMIIFAGLAITLGSGDKEVEERIDKYVGQLDQVATVEEEGEEKERKPSRLTQRFDEAISERKFGSQMAAELARADLKLTVGEFIIFRLTSTLFGGLLAFILGGLFLIPVGLLGGYFFPKLYVALRKRRRLSQFNDQLGDSITLMANGLRAGYSLLQAMETISKELPSPISTEFERVVREISLGIPNEQAMNNLLRRIQSDDLDLMITAINVQHEVGGNLSEILETIGHTIRERVRIQGEIRVLTAQGMMTGYVISFLPVALGLVLFLINRKYMMSMFQEPCGWAMIGFCVITISAGFFAIQKIVRIEV
jgi:tight adherence protein B